MGRILGSLYVTVGGIVGSVGLYNILHSKTATDMVYGILLLGFTGFGIASAYRELRERS